MLLARLLVLSELGCVNTFSGVSCLVDVSSLSGPSGLAGAWMQLLLRSSSVSCLSGLSWGSNFSGVSCFNGVPELVAAFMKLLSRRSCIPCLSELSFISMSIGLVVLVVLVALAFISVREEEI